MTQPTHTPAPQFNFQDKFDTPFGFAKCTSYGSCGSTKNARLMLDDGTEVYFSEGTGFERQLERSKRTWEKEYSELSKTEVFVLQYTFPDVEKSIDFTKIDTPKNLVTKSIKTCIKNKIIEAEVCSRCGGCWKYSFCEMYRDKCFKCAGSGKTPPKVSKVKKAIQAIAKAEGR